MKASLKFREDQKPLIKAKVPISILGLPFLTGVSAGETKELRLDLVTAFDSGPSLRASYRPNDPSAPFAVSLRTGVGPLGSPIAAPMSMTAEFGFGGGCGGGSPTFVVLFKPRLGDFSFRKATTSVAKKEAGKIDGDAPAVWVEKVARSVLPVRSRAEVRFKWGVRVPAELRSAFASAAEDGSRVGRGGVSFGKLPLLVMSKISVVHVAEDKREAEMKKKEEDDVSKEVADVAGACMEVKKQLEAVQAENGSLRSSVEELKARFQFNGGTGGAGANSCGKGGTRKPPESSGRAAVAAGPTKDDVNEELKKALKGATGGGAN